MSFSRVSSSIDHLFYIYTPSWRENAAGIRVLHYLCDSLNKAGYSAYLVLHNPFESNIQTNPLLTTPVLSQDLADLHFRNGRVPTVIYSETIPGNPLRASRVVRYLLNYPGALGGSTKFSPNELLVSYTKAIKEFSSQESLLLFLPAIKRDELPKVKEKDPNLRLIYAGKYRAFVGPPPRVIEFPVTEIYRDGPLRQSRTEVLDLLSQASVLYLWENSSIATEAILLDTPCVFIENEFLGRIIAETELGLDGITFSNTEEGLKEARESLPLAKLRYLEAEKEFWNSLNNFIKEHDSHFNKHFRSAKRIRVPKSKHLVNKHRIALFFGLLRNLGISKTLRVTKEFTNLRISRIRNKNERK
jgi:hypothetical protein